MAATDFDVIISGAGPAGSTAAYYLVQKAKAAGIAVKVGLFDKAKFPRDKFCGDAWCAPALDILEDMGVLQELEKRGVVSETLAGGFVSPSGYSFIANDKGATEKNMSTRAYAIKRMICDEAIARKAQEVGATLVEESMVDDATLDENRGVWTVKTADGRKYTCKILVAADGAASNLARKLGVILTPPSGVAARQYIKGGTHNFKADGVLLYPEYTLPGYMALFRHYDDSIDLGAYILPGGAAKEEDLADIYANKIRTDPFISRALGPNWEPLERVKVASLRLGGVPRSYGDRFFIVGDAAGQVDPLTGEGIHTAMIAARMLGGIMVEMLSTGDYSIRFGEIYHRMWWNTFGSDFPKSALAAQGVFKLPFLMDAVPLAAAAKGTGKAATAFFADFGAVMTGVKPKTTFIMPSTAWPLAKATLGVLVSKLLNTSRAYFEDPFTGPVAKYEMDRSTSWAAQCLIDPTVPVGSEESEQSRLDRVIREMFAWEAEAKNRMPVLVVYGTEYGYSEEIATKLCEALYESGKFRPRKIDLAFWSLIDWSRERFVLFICSTAGDGDPPVETRQFFKDFLDDQAVQLDARANVSFAVLAPGDSAYPHFCAAGKRLAAGLKLKRGFSELQRDCTCQELDGDKPSVYESWISRVVGACTQYTETNSELLQWTRMNFVDDQEGDYLIARAKQSGGLLVREKRATRQEPFRARLVKRERLTAHPPCGPGEEKWHIVVDCKGSDKLLQYLPGDALGVLPRNDPHEVDRFIHKLFLPKALSKEAFHSIFEELSTKRNIKDGTEGFYRALFNAREPQVEHLEEYWLSDLLDQSLWRGCNETEGRKIIATMGELMPRFYSICSSPTADGDQIHLCVAKVVYEVNDRVVTGACSGHLCDRLKLNDTVDVFIQRNPDFRLPPPGEPMLMVGPGTGIAPFRAFAREDQALNNPKRDAMMFFGCRFSRGDWLYPNDFDQYDYIVAFSREQPDKKVYVQHKILEKSKEVYERIISKKAPVFICGDGWNMARDVEAALAKVALDHGAAKTSEEAAALIKSLVHLDVWVV